MLFATYMNELRSRCINNNTKVQFVVVFKKPKPKELKKIQQLQTVFYLSQDHKIGFIGVPQQEKDLKKQGLGNVLTKNQILNPKNYKFDNISTLLTNPSALRQLSISERERLSYWEKFPSLQGKEFVYELKDISRHRQKPYKFKWNTSHSLSIPIGIIGESNVALKKQFEDIVSQYKTLLSPKLYPVKDYKLVTTQGSVIDLTTKFIMEN